MAINIVEELHSHIAVRNHARITARCSALYNTADERSALAVLIDDGDRPSDGDTITLTATVLGEDLELTFKDTPVYEDLDLPAYASGSTESYVDVLVAALRNIHSISSLYTITRVNAGAWGVLLRARAVNDGTYDIDAAVSGWTPVAISPIDVTPYVGVPNARAVFSLHALLDSSFFTTLEDALVDDLFELVNEESWPVNRIEGTASFSVHDQLRALLAATIPTPGGTAAITAWASFCPFYVRVGEEYGDPATIKPMTTTEVCWAYLAGRSEAERVDTSDWSDVLFANQMKFLSPWPNGSALNAKEVVPEQEEYLAFVYDPARASIRIKADLYYETGNEITGHLLEQLDGQDHELILTPVGVIARGLHLVDTSRRLRAYRIYLSTVAGSRLGEYRYYHVDYTNHRHTRQLMYWSTRGGCDTIVLHGTQEATAMPDMERSLRHVDVPATIPDANDAVAYLSGIKTERSAGTMYLTQAELPVLADLFASESVQILIGTRWIPIELIGKSEIATQNEAKRLEARKIEYRYALRPTAVGLSDV